MKVTINGEAFEWDPEHKPLSEAMALEKALGWRWQQFEDELQAGSARALAAFCWLVWHRNGRGVPWSDIEDGTVEINVEDCDFGAPQETEADPTQPGSGTATSPSTAASTSLPSASSASAPGSSGS